MESDAEYGEAEFANEVKEKDEPIEADEEEYDVSQREAVGSGVNVDVVDGSEDQNELSVPIDVAPVDDVDVDVVEEIEQKKPVEPRREGDFVMTCGPGGMLVVDPAFDTWPRELSLFVLDNMYDVPLPEQAECLAIDTLLRMSGLEFEVEVPGNIENMSPSGCAPFLKVGPFLVSELEPIVRHLSRKGASRSGDLSEEATQRQTELWALIKTSLAAAEQRVCWLHYNTRRYLTEPRVCRHMPWPLSSIVARRKRRQALAWLASQEPNGTDLELSLDMVYKQVDEVCSTLSTELGAGPYFFGQAPTELEALLYGHLYLLLTVPVPVDERTSLSQVIQQYPNLVSLVAKIDEEVFGRELDAVMEK